MDEMTMVDWEAVCETARAHIGHISRFSLGKVSALQFQRFAIAAGDKSKRYFDNELPRPQGFSGAVAPPLFLSAVMGWEAGPDQESLRLDGAGRVEVTSLPLDGLRLMGAGQDLEFVRPVVDGCEVTQEVSIEDVQLKQGKSGTLLIFSLLRRYVDQDGRELVRCRDNFIGR
jgi:acyl dehydratase